MFLSLSAPFLSHSLYAPAIPALTQLRHNNKTFRPSGISSSLLVFILQRLASVLSGQKQILICSFYSLVHQKKKKNQVSLISEITNCQALRFETRKDSSLRSQHFKRLVF
jgi:hypothetical protein